jgi:hypothetical protein
MIWIDRRWNPQQGRELAKLLVRVYRSEDAVRDLLEDIDAAAEMPVGVPNIGVLWERLLENLNDSRRLRPLLDAVVANDAGLEAQVRELSEEEICAGTGNPQDAYQVRLLGPARRPMIDRAELRRNLKGFMDERDRPVLLIRGPTQSGKSYSFQLMKHVAGGLDDPRLILIDFSYAASGNTATALMAMICSRLGLRDVTGRAKRTTATKFAAELVDDLVGAYRFDDRITRILVIDGLNRPDLDPDVHNLVVKLATEVVNDQLSRTKLVLTGYPGTIDRQLSFSMMSEDIRTLTETDIWLYFKELSDELGKPLPEDELGDLVRKAMAGESGLEALADRVHELALGLVGMR